MSEQSQIYAGICGNTISFDVQGDKMLMVLTKARNPGVYPGYLLLTKKTAIEMRERLTYLIDKLEKGDS
jgi:hypothetical protein